MKGQGKTIVRDEPVASIVQEAMEGFALGRFQTQAEVRRFLQADLRYPRGKSGHVGPEAVSQMLRKPFYAGYFRSEAYGLKWHKMKHEGLISLEAFQKIQDRLAGKAKAPKRADIGDAFALRGTVACVGCQTPLRSYFATGCHGNRFPYYMCGKNGCEHYAKSTKRDVLENQVGNMIKTFEPSEGNPTLTRAMFQKAWDLGAAQANEIKIASAQKIKTVEKDIDGFLDRILATANR